VVLAESFERIHRANLIGVGILPLTFGAGTSRKTLVLTGREQFHLHGLQAGLQVAGKLMLDIVRENGDVETVPVFLSVETENEIQVLRTGGLLPVLLEEFAKAG
jgi:aconitate hydratase